jgi:type IV pilus assembly protein PilV
MTQRMQFPFTGRGVGWRQVAARQSGVGLIEVLVAVLVLSIGFVGIAALQVRSLSMNNSSMTRSVATMDTYSILDAMRADLVNAQSGAYNGPVAANACPTTTGSLANTQLTIWCNRLAADLGASASGNINCVSSLGSCTITVTYDDSKSKSTATDTTGTQTVTTQAML